MKIIKDETGIYIELPKDSIKFDSKEKEIIYDLTLENERLKDYSEHLERLCEMFVQNEDNKKLLLYRTKINRAMMCIVSLEKEINEKTITGLGQFYIKLEKLKESLNEILKN